MLHWIIAYLIVINLVIIGLTLFLYSITAAIVCTDTDNTTFVRLYGYFIRLVILSIIAYPLINLVKNRIYG